MKQRFAIERLAESAMEWIHSMIGLDRAAWHLRPRRLLLICLGVMAAIVPTPERHVSAAPDPDTTTEFNRTLRAPVAPAIRTPLQPSVRPAIESATPVPGATTNPEVTPTPAPERSPPPATLSPELLLREGIRDIFRGREITPVPTPTPRDTLALNASRTRITEGESVRLTAVIRPNASRSALYSFDVNGSSEASGRVNYYDRRFDRAGRYAVVARANLGPDGPFLTSDTVYIDVNRPTVEYRLGLRAMGPTDITAGETLRFAAALSPAVDAEYGLRINDATVSTSASGTFSHRFTSPGTYRVSAMARPRSGTSIARTYAAAAPLIESREFVVRVSEPRPPPLRISIAADRPEVTRGTPVTLRARVDPDSAPIREYRWRGPRGRTGNAQRLVLTTEGLSAGWHDVVLEAVDRHGQEARASTRIRVIEPAVPLSVSITATRTRVTQGTSITMNAVTRPDDARIVRYEWRTPDGQSGNTQRFVLQTGTLEPGTHRVSVSVYDRSGEAANASVAIDVEPPEAPWQRPLAVIDPYSTDLSFGDAVTFESRSTSDPRSGLRLQWQGPNDSRGDGARFTLGPGQLPVGEHRVSLTATDDRGYSDTASVSFRVAPREIALSVEIDPPRPSVSLGETVVFRDVTPLGPGATPSRRWRGPAGITGTGPELVVDSAGLTPGGYEVVLELALSQHNEYADGTGRARLTVREPVLGLSVDRTTLPPDETMTFSSRVSERIADQTYDLHFNDRVIATIRNSTVTRYRQPTKGTYQAYLSTRIGGREYRSNVLRIHVAEPAPPMPVWPWLLPLLAIPAVTLLYAKLVRPPPVTLADLRVIPVVDRHPTAGLDDSPKHEGIRLVMVRDLGEQSLHTLDPHGERD